MPVSEIEIRKKRVHEKRMMKSGGKQARSVASLSHKPPQENINPGQSSSPCQYIRCRNETTNFFCQKHLQSEEFDIKLSENVMISPITLKRNRKGAGSFYENISLAHALYATPTTNMKMPKGTKHRVEENFQKTLLHNNDFLGNLLKSLKKLIFPSHFRSGLPNLYWRWSWEGIFPRTYERVPHCDPQRE